MKLVSLLEQKSIQNKLVLPQIRTRSMENVLNELLNIMFQNQKHRSSCSGIKLLNLLSFEEPLTVHVNTIHVARDLIMCDKQLEEVW